MTNIISNQSLVKMIRFSDLVRDETSIQMARDLQVLTHSDCCMKERLSFWEEFYLDKVAEFENYCVSEMPEGSDGLIEEFYELVVEDQLDLILGDASWPQTESCECKCVISVALE